MCLLKYARYCSGNNPTHPELVPSTCVLYTTMEPCSSRLSGNVTCVEHIIKRGIKRVVIGVLEPEIFVKDCEGRERERERGCEEMGWDGMGWHGYDRGRGECHGINIVYAMTICPFMS